MCESLREAQGGIGFVAAYAILGSFLIVVTGTVSLIYFPFWSGMLIALGVSSISIILVAICVALKNGVDSHSSVTIRHSS